MCNNENPANATRFPAVSVLSFQSGSISTGTTTISASSPAPEATTTTTAVTATTAIAATAAAVAARIASSSNLLPIDHYRLQLYQYAAVAERLRYPLLAPFPNSVAPLPLPCYPLFPRGLQLQPEEPKPQHSYIGLIAMAILSTPDGKLVLSDIYQHILDHYPYFRSRGPGWRNSIRHNLSLNDCFIKAGRSANGKGHYWAIHPANVDDFRKGDFRRRKAQRKVRRHMGLAVDEETADSPSPPPLPVLPPPPPPPPALPPPATVPSRKRQFDVASLLAPDSGDSAGARTDLDVVNATGGGDIPLQTQSYLHLPDSAAQTAQTQLDARNTWSQHMFPIVNYYQALLQVKPPHQSVVVSSATNHHHSDVTDL